MLCRRIGYPSVRPVLFTWAMVVVMGSSTCSRTPDHEPMPEPKSFRCPAWAYGVPATQERLPPIDISGYLIKCIDHAWRNCTSGRVDYSVEVGAVGQILRVTAKDNGFSDEARCVEANIKSQMLVEPAVDCRGVGVPSRAEGYVSWSPGGIQLAGLGTDGVAAASPLCALTRRGITTQ